MRNSDSCRSDLFTSSFTLTTWSVGPRVAVPVSDRWSLEAAFQWTRGSSDGVWRGRATGASLGRAPRGAHGGLSVVGGASRRWAAHWAATVVARRDSPQIATCIEDIYDPCCGTTAFRTVEVEPPGAEGRTYAGAGDGRVDSSGGSMSDVWRRLRASLALGAIWAGGGAFIGSLVELASNLFPTLPLGFVDMWIPTLAIPGFIGGVVFSGVVGVAARNRRFDELSLPGITALGAGGGVLLGGVMMALGAGAFILLDRKSVV